jgi:hypothetical protein
MSKLEGKEPHTLVSDEVRAQHHSHVQTLLARLETADTEVKIAIWEWLDADPNAIEMLQTACMRYPQVAAPPAAQPPMTPHQFMPVLGSRLCEVCSFDKWHALHRAWEIAQRQPAAK